MRPVDHVLRVFTDAEGRFGNFLGAFLDTEGWSDEFCQSRAFDLGFSETVFIDDIATGRIRIFTPKVKLGFAGHPTVGAAWLIDHLGHEIHTLQCDVGTIYTVATQLGATVLADPAWCPAITLHQEPSPEVVDSYVPWDESEEYAWAWIDERPVRSVPARSSGGWAFPRMRPPGRPRSCWPRNSTGRCGSSRVRGRGSMWGRPTRARSRSAEMYD